MISVPMAALSEALKRKIADVSKSRRHIVRRLTGEEAETLRSVDGWMNGWFKDPTGSQIVLERRRDGQEVIFRIG